ncbi:universal stress protein [Streptomyces sioyaensis]|uniref:Universal stress protein n=1 Tax=Streptomyces sioyaensis TaxID=67364 RepID=A0A4Q1QZT1_9ACTN|nr:universal stress protein [Streptomyces sioyaensis]RXS67626.1 universal stress protein [Streptomyces sioyaensis]
MNSQPNGHDTRPNGSDIQPSGSDNQPSGSDSRPDGHECIVVGVDGSESSKDALHWAVRQAELDHCTVHAVLAWEYPPLYGSIGWIDAPQHLAADLKVRADQTLDGAIGEVVRAHDAPRVSATVAYGTPSGVLHHAARDASLLVVGRRRRRILGALGGSLSRHVTRRAPCPVVVVGERSRRV